MLITYGARDSRCLYPANAPQAIHWAVIDGDRRAVVSELETVVRDGVPSKALVDAWADLRALLERFASCLAVDPDDVKPIAQDERLWEMRLNIETYRLFVRIYETEISELPGHIVALRAHKKLVGVDEAETKALQDAEIAVASARWDSGRPHFWGLT